MTHVLMKSGPFAGRFLKMEDEEAKKAISDGTGVDAEKESARLAKLTPEKRAEEDLKAYEDAYSKRLDAPETTADGRLTADVEKENAANEKAKAKAQAKAPAEVTPAPAPAEANTAKAAPEAAPAPTPAKQPEKKQP